MRVKLKKNKNFHPQKFQKGQIAQIPDNVAQRWIVRNIAEPAIEQYSGDLTDYIHHPKVSVIILVKDALEYVKKCLFSVARYTQNYELIIIDNGSRAETRNFLDELQPKLNFKLVRNSTNRGFSYGCNQGIKVSTCEYLCFLNSDTMVTPNWLGKLMKGFSKPDAGIVGPSTCWCAGEQCIKYLKNRRHNIDQTEADSISYSIDQGIVKTEIYGFCFTVARKVIDDIGVFDHKRYPIGSSEERDFSWRAYKAGYKSYWVKDSYVHHFGSRTFSEIGIKPESVRVKNQKVFEERKSNSDIYVANTVNIIHFTDNQPEIIPILMIVLDRLEYTKKAIGALLANTQHPFRLFIFNNGSDAETTKYLEGINDVRVELYRSKTNLGLIPPMNMFFDRFKNCEYVAKVDNDTVVPTGWLGKLKKVMDTYPLFTVEADHYLAMPFEIETNDDFYKHLFGVEFGGGTVYFYPNSGGTGQLIRRSVIDEPVAEKQGSLSGWVRYQQNRYKRWPSAFYTGTWIDRLDQVDTNKYKGESDYPEYDKMISKMRPGGLGRSKMNISRMAGIKKEMESWYSGL